MVNRVILIGNLGKDPEGRATSGGTQLVNFSLATSRWVNGKEETTWVDIVAFGKTAETCLNYLQKGRQVFIEGRLNVREYESKDGKKIRKTEVVAERVQFLGSKRENQDAAGRADVLDRGQGKKPWEGGGDDDF